MQVKSDKKDYEFQKYIDGQKHLDTDETRHLIKPIVHVITEDFKGEEHKYCDKEQRNAEGKFRRPKKLIESEQKGFKSVYDMVEADKKAEEDAKKKEVSDLRDFTTKQNDVIKKLIDKQDEAKQSLDSLILDSKSRIDKLEETIVQQNLLLEKIISRLAK
jgi:hypothetical protein